MADLGDVVGSLMSSLLRARFIADEQTAALAELYKNNPLLEGLSVPRIRIPELTIDMPILIENFQEGEVGEMAHPDNITNEAVSQLKSSLAKIKKELPDSFFTSFADETKERLTLTGQEKNSVTKEAAVRNVQTAVFDTLAKTDITLSSTEKEAIARDIRSKIAAVSLSKASVSPKIIPNVKTADVKERASSTSVVRLKVTFKEEGLEWATQVSESGGVVRTLQPE
ncbi:MAG: hypothetical protein RL497_641 [Pseudomonadota bacterium]|jgi:hypothetical protein